MEPCIIADGRSGANRNMITTVKRVSTNDYSRWEIGGEPQLMFLICQPKELIIADGRSGANRNSFLYLYPLLSRL